MDESHQQGDGGDLRLPGGRVVPASLLRLTAVRSSGPGGQNVNKTSTKVQLWIGLRDLEPILGGPAVQRLRDLARAYVTGSDQLLLTCSQTRSQQMNREACLARLRGLLVASLRAPRARRRTAPTRASKRRRLDDKARASLRKRERRRPDEH